MSPRPPPPVCAICGAQIPNRARACPECGADERNGWDDQSIYDGVDLPIHADDDDQSPKPPFVGVAQGVKLLAAVLILTAFVLWIWRGP